MNIGEAIVSFAQREGCHLIIVGAGGYNRNIGSVSETIVHHSWIPVLVCPKESLISNSDSQ